MTDIERAAEIRGRTIRFIWTEGPTRGAKERPQYAAIRVADRIYAVSYLASSGYTPTVVLDFGDQGLTGLASSSKDWHPVQGTFQVMK